MEGENPQQKEANESDLLVYFKVSEETTFLSKYQPPKLSKSRQINTEEQAFQHLRLSVCVRRWLVGGSLLSSRIQSLPFFPHLPNLKPNTPHHHHHVPLTQKQKWVGKS